MRKLVMLCPILILILTGCMSQEVIESHISYYEGTIKNISENVLTLETPDNQTISFIADRQSAIKDVEINDIVYIECEENSATDIKNIVKIDILEDSIEVNFISRMIYIHDNIYVESLPAETEEREGIIDGILDTSVLKNQKPTLHNQSNFGIGYEYKMVNGERVDVLIDGQWIKFVKLSDNIIYYNTYAFDKSALSQDTLKWLEKYNELSEIEKSSISFVPHELIPSPIARATSYIIPYHDILIETENGAINIDVQNFKIEESNNLILNLIITNETNTDYKLTEENIQLIKMGKINDGFITVYPQADSSVFTTIPSLNSVERTLVFKTPIDFENYEILIQTNGGMYRVQDFS